MQGRDQRQKEDKVESTPDPVDLFFHAKFPHSYSSPRYRKERSKGFRSGDERKSRKEVILLTQAKRQTLGASGRVQKV